jgi:hypothetical protein
MPQNSKHTGRNLPHGTPSAPPGAGKYLYLWGGKGGSEYIEVAASRTALRENSVAKKQNGYELLPLAEYTYKHVISKDVSF